MIANFDQVLFLVSTDFFSKNLFEGFLQRDIDIVKMAAKEEILTILNGSDNYYMAADFSSSRRENTEKNFFEKLQMRGVDIAIQRRVIYFFNILENISDSFSTATSEIVRVASDLNWLQVDDLLTPIPDEIVGYMAMIESIGLDSERCEYVDWEELWLKSTSSWDKYLMSVMDGIPETPSNVYREITEYPSKLDFLRLWKNRLGEDRFSVLKEYIRVEARAQLIEINPNSAKEVDEILAAF